MDLNFWDTFRLEKNLVLDQKNWVNLLTALVNVDTYSSSSPEDFVATLIL